MNIASLHEQLQKGIHALIECGNLKETDLDYNISAEKSTELGVKKTGKELYITYDQESHFYMLLARGLVMEDGEQKFTPKVKRLGMMMDCSRNAVATVKNIKNLIGILALMGYDYLELYTEETYELPGEPYFGYMRGRYSVQEIKECIQYAAMFGLEVVPCIQTLAHLANLVRWKPYAEYSDIDDILLVHDERTYALIRKMLQFCKDTYLTDRVHIGMDEAFRLGRGKYTDTYGYHDKKEIYLEHLQKVFAICDEIGLKPEFWADGIYETDWPKEQLQQIFNGNQTPIYWDYFTDKKEEHAEKMTRLQEYAGKTGFAGGLWRWIGYAPNNAWSDKVTDAAYEAAVECGVDDILMTAWGDNGAECSQYAVLPAMWHAAEVAYPFKTDRDEMLRMLTGYTDTEWRMCDKLNHVMDDTSEICNAFKYALYNDFLIGLMDDNIPWHAGEIYEKLSDTFDELAKRESPYRYLFATYAAGCRLLTRKATYGKRLYQAYHEMDRAELRVFVDELDAIEKDLRAFYDMARIQWMTENKGFGFEVLDARIGGLVGRVETVRYELTAYIDGRTDRIYELEEKRLDFYCGQYEGDAKYNRPSNVWSQMYTANNI